MLAALILPFAPDLNAVVIMQIQGKEYNTPSSFCRGRMNSWSFSSEGQQLSQPRPASPALVRSLLQRPEEERPKMRIASAYEFTCEFILLSENRLIMQQITRQ